MRGLTTKLYGKGAKVSGPFKVTKTGRMHVAVWLPVSRTSVSLTLARFRMQEHLGRILATEEEVDHIDENPLNDELTNLQVLTKPENVAKSQTKYTEDKEVQCFFCPKKFVLTPKQQRQRHMNRNRTSGPFCSHSCAAKFRNMQR